MKTLKLFNAVIAKPSVANPYLSDLGFVIEPEAFWAKDQIIAYYAQEQLDGNQLNKSFHKSWKKIAESSRADLFIEQIQHYLSTYGTNFSSEVYIPDEVLNLPDVKLTYKVIQAFSKPKMIHKCLSLLQSGIALKEETVDDVLSILVDELDYQFTGKETIKNKEALVKIAENYQVYPENPVEFLRYIIYRTTDTTLLIKNKELVELIKTSSYNPSASFKNFGLEKLAEIFNRFKPLFLAYKNRAPKTINKISKLSKKHHKPLVNNPLNEVTQQLLSPANLHWLDNATPFTLFKALIACYSRKEGQDTFVYRIRNGKSWVQKDAVSYVNAKNYAFLMKYLQGRFDLSEKTFFIPEDVKYGVPTSEKMFVGNVPTGTRFYGDKLAVGIYWENAWGARDLDLSGLNIGGKVGWNSSYNQSEGSLMYSGDVTDATEGAIEYLYAQQGLTAPTLIQNNVYQGETNASYKIIIGKGDAVDKDYMMNPNKVITELKTNAAQQQTVLGMLIPEEEKQCFVVLNFGAGTLKVSGNSEVSTLATRALVQQWTNPLSLNELLVALGAKKVEEKTQATFDLSLENLTKDRLMTIFS
ncbi:hypothetical protein [Mesonia aestuariivivens]|uniref:Uncharacterized protein n=1 Tax=Mesonia aestuariivivens TaxID=2796128 RepID=A0ABS6W091_9FLAO|nr:hypothetical protein [Mesonia aestuariivivens]MBW2960539.1 hypothetical protein [Mesonia aestuariivivens]